MRHIKALSKKTTPALAGTVLCYTYLLEGDFQTYKECKLSGEHLA